MVKPKRCARAWARGCDGDGDGEIAHAEWVACLLVNPEPPAPDCEYLNGYVICKKRHNLQNKKKIGKLEKDLRAHKSKKNQQM